MYGKSAKYILVGWSGEQLHKHPISNSAPQSFQATIISRNGYPVSAMLASHKASASTSTRTLTKRYTTVY
eukprot:scaffold42219_cov33-Prasinocladus_malaysianus.AAC.1